MSSAGSGTHAETDNPIITVRIMRAWDEARWQTASSRPKGSAAALLCWTIEPRPVDAGVPGPVARAVAEAAVSIGAVALRLFFKGEMPDGLIFHPAPRAWPGRWIIERLTRTWPADIAIAAMVEGAAEMFLQDWELQGQTALVLRDAALSHESMDRLRRSRDWRRQNFPADARLLIAPAVDGDGILFAAASAGELADVLGRLPQAFEHAGVTIDGEAGTDSDLPPMEVASSHHVDASEPDEEGFYEYYYEYDIYEFSRADRTYVARAYIDTPDRAAFLSRLDGTESHLLGPADVIDPLLVEAVDYLHAAGKTTLDRLTGTEGYVPLEVVAAPGSCGWEPT